MAKTLKVTQAIMLFFTVTLSPVVFSQPTTPASWGLKEFSLNDRKTGPVYFYVDTTNITKKAPLLIFLQGSGGYPMVFYNEGESFSFTTCTFDSELLRQQAKEFHFVMINKPGLHFCDTIKTNQRDPYKILENYIPPRYYTENLSMEWRVASARAVISFLIKNNFYDRSKIVAWGFSEGGQVVPRLAAQDKRVTHVVSVVGSGLNQFYDHIIKTRIKVVKGEYTHQKAQLEIDSYLFQFKEIYNHRNATDKTFDGHSYKRWASFCAEDPVKSLVQLTIPIYMVVGSADVNSPIYGLDYVPLEFARLRKENLTYDVCVGCDHFQTIIETPDDSLKEKSLGGEYLKKIAEWLNRH